METKTKVNFFLIASSIILAAILPSIAIAAFGLVGGVGICIITILTILHIGD